MRTKDLLTRDVVARLTSTALVILATSLIASLILLVSGVSPSATLSAYWGGTFGNSTNVGTTLTQAVPLLLVALGWIVSTRAGRLHVGFPGQIIAGGCLATAIGLHCGGIPGPLAVLVTAIAGITGGALWAGIAAWLWASRGVLEIISTLLLNLVAVQIAAWLVRGPLQGSAAHQPQTADFPSSTAWPSVHSIPGQTLSYDVVLMPVAALVVVLFLSRTVFGFGLRASGGNPHAARWSGINPKRDGVLAIVISGGFAGLAGAALLFAGTAPWLSDGFESGVGFNGIAVALLASNSAFVAILTSIVFASLNVGAISVQAHLDVPASLAEMLQGTVIVLVLVATAVVRRRIGPAQSDPAAASVASTAAVGFGEI
jgi:ABC-type uncharacterized transport system permease subunit